MVACMLDLETLDIKTSAVILTVGAVRFDPYSMEPPHTPFYEAIDVDEQFTLGRTYSEDTIAWWAKQPEAIKAEAFGENGEKVPVAEFLARLSKYLVGVTHIYAHGVIFDIPILESLYYDGERSAPWQYWQIMDSRTIFELVGDPREKNKDNLHNALADAYNQAVGVQQVFKQLGIRERAPTR